MNKKTPTQEAPEAFPGPIAKDPTPDYQAELASLRASLGVQAETISQLQALYRFVMQQRDNLLINQANMEVNAHLASLQK